ncbi:hypothetical protein Tco_0747681 [Tanacetum coccineum]|uniref:Uncharacterized protein n=1 Tax=Tanacetum coccineum TaxID=301880 RepID=A0ABQ4YUD5_9ASTR
MEQHRLEFKTFEVKMNQVLNENERLMEQVLSKDIVNIIVNSSMNNASVNVHECAYIKHTQEEATVLRDLVEQVKSKYPLDHSLESACRYAKLIQELLTNISKTCPSINNTDGKLVAVTPKNKDKRHSKLNANSEIKCVKCNGCMLSDNHDMCVLDFINNVNARVKSKSIPTGRTFTIVGNAYPLTRITTTTEVPLRKPTALENEPPKPVVTLVYSRKPRKSKTNVPVSKSNLKFLNLSSKLFSDIWTPAAPSI